MSSLLHTIHLDLTCMHVNSGIQSLRQQTCLHCLQGSSDGKALGPHVAGPHQAQALRPQRLHPQLLPWLRRPTARLQLPRTRACTGAQRLGSERYRGRGAAAHWHIAACCRYAATLRHAWQCLLFFVARRKPLQGTLTVKTRSPGTQVLGRAWLGQWLATLCAPHHPACWFCTTCVQALEGPTAYLDRLPS